jgi:hypothetical protein
MDLAKEKKEVAEKQKRMEQQQAKEDVREQHEQRRAEIYAINHVLKALSERKLAEYQAKHLQRQRQAGTGVAEGTAADVAEDTDAEEVLEEIGQIGAGPEG